MSIPDLTGAYKPKVTHRETQEEFYFLKIYILLFFFGHPRTAATAGGGVSGVFPLRAGRDGNLCSRTENYKTAADQLAATARNSLTEICLIFGDFWLFVSGG